MLYIILKLKGFKNLLYRTFVCRGFIQVPQLNAHIKNTVIVMASICVHRNKLTSVLHISFYMVEILLFKNICNKVMSYCMQYMSPLPV